MEQDWKSRILSAIWDYACGHGERGGKHPLIKLGDNLREASSSSNGEITRVLAELVKEGPPALEEFVRGELAEVGGQSEQKISSDVYWRALMHVVRDFCQDSSGRLITDCQQLQDAFRSRLIGLIENRNRANRLDSADSAFILAGIAASGGYIEQKYLDLLYDVKKNHPLIWLKVAFYLKYHEIMVQEIRNILEYGNDNIPKERFLFALHEWMGRKELKNKIIDIIICIYLNLERRNPHEDSKSDIIDSIMKKYKIHSIEKHLELSNYIDSGTFSSAPFFESEMFNDDMVAQGAPRAGAPHASTCDGAAQVNI